MATTARARQRSPRPGRSPRGRRLVLAAGLGVVVVTVTAAAALSPRDGGEATALTVAPTDVSAVCATLTPEALAAHELAFEGRVTGVEGDRVTLEVVRTFTGDAGARVVLTRPEVGSSDLSATSVDPGGTYLLSADGGRVAACGQSGPAGPELTALYEQAFSG